MSGKTQQDMDELLARAKQLSTDSNTPTIDSIRQSRAQVAAVPVTAAPTTTAAIPGLSPTPDRSVIGSGSGPSTTTGAPTATTGTSTGGAPATSAPATGTSAFSGSAPASSGAGAAGTSSGGGSGSGAQTSAAAAAREKMARADSDFGEYEWVSDLMGKMWPYVTKAVTKEAQAQLPGLLKTSKPTWMGDILLHKFELGGEPPKLSDIKVVKQEGEKELSGDDLIYIETDFDWVSQQDVEMDISPLPEKISYVPGFISKAVSKLTTFRCGVEDFSMHGQLRITLRPMLSVIPVIAAMQVSLIEAPEFDFTITFGADDKPLKLFPSLKSWMYSFICDTLLAAYVLPDHYFYALDPTAPDFNIPVGIIECTVVECKNVPKMDYIGSTTAYVELATHKRGAAQTNLQDGKTPVWNETYSLPVHVKEHQKLTAIMYDQDVGADDEIGRAMVSLKDLQPDQVVDIWVPVKPLMEQDSAKDKEQGPTRKREKLAAAVTSPFQPANPSDKGTELHLRLQYRDLTVQQTQMVIDWQRNGTPIPDERLRKLLEEAKPATASAADFSAKPALGDGPTTAQKNAEAR